LPSQKENPWTPNHKNYTTACREKRADDAHVSVYIRYSRKEYVSRDDKGIWGNWQDGFINACQGYLHLWAIPNDALIRMRPAGRCTDDQELIMVEYR
jgi:adenylylsulfate kinase-like enzyme